MYDSYEKQAETFLQENRIGFRAENVGRSFILGMRCYKYRITLTQVADGESRRWSFDFWSSNHDYEQGIKTVTAYDVLASVSGDQYYTDENMIRNELGYTDEDAISSIIRHAKEMNAFFTERQLEQLSEIN